MIRRKGSRQKEQLVQKSGYNLCSKHGKQACETNEEKSVSKRCQRSKQELYPSVLQTKIRSLDFILGALKNHLRILSSLGGIIQFIFLNNHSGCYADQNQEDKSGGTCFRSKQNKPKRRQSILGWQQWRQNVDGVGIGFEDKINRMC